MQVPADKKQLRQARIMTYFIDATNQIISQEGIAGVTVRKVADLAGYNSATLYKYFDNLNHLIFLTSLDHLEAYQAAIPAYIEGCKNVLEAHLAISECFCKYSFASPERYALLFFSGQENKLEAYIQQYDTLFPDRIKGTSTSMFKSVHINDIYSKHTGLLASCVEEGYMTQAAADDFNEIALMIYKCILQDVRAGRLFQEEAVTKSSRHYRRIMTCYLNPEYRHLLDVL